MPEGTTGRFTDAADYQTSLPDLAVNLVVTQPGMFGAQLISVKLPNIHLLRAEETLARVAYMVLPTALAFVSFATRPGPALFWDGLELPPGHMVFHSPGERLHQRSTGASHWGFLAIKPSFFARYGSALAGHCLEPPPTASIVRPRSADLTRLLRLHARVAHLVEKRPVTIGHPEVGRAVEHELLDALVACVIGGEARMPSRTARRHAAIMVRFEAALTEYSDLPLTMADLCASVGITERTLRACCVEMLGIGPGVYMRLRRLHRVRAVIIRAELGTVAIRDIARRFGFHDMGRFAAAYRTAFGETPSATMRRAGNLPTRF